jgi:hypothetical protein
VEYEEILDNLAHKKIKLLKMKQAAEKIQNHKVNLTNQDIDKMLDVPVEKKRRSSRTEKKVYEEDKADEEGDDLEDMSFDGEGEELEDDSDMEEIEDGDLDNEEEEGDDDDEELEEGDLKELANEDLENVSYYSDDEEKPRGKYVIESDELISDEDEEILERNIHGFLEPENLLTYKKTYREKSADLKNQTKEEYKHHRKKQKLGGTTNKEKEKGKPLMMVISKKRRLVSDKMVNKCN